MEPLVVRALFVALFSIAVLASAPPTATAESSITVTIEYTAAHFRLPDSNPEGCTGWTMQSMPPIFVVECALPDGVVCAAPWAEVGFTGVTGGLGGRTICGTPGEDVSAGCSTSAKFPPPVPFPPAYHTCVAVEEGSGSGMFVCRAVPLEGFSALQLDGVVRCRADLA